MKCTNDKCTSTDVMRKVNADYAQCQVCGHHWNPSRYIKTFEDLTEEDAIKIAGAATGLNYWELEEKSEDGVFLYADYGLNPQKCEFRIYRKGGVKGCLGNRVIWIDFMKAAQKANELGYYLY